MDINLKLEEYTVSKEDLAYVLSVNVLKQLGLELKGEDVVKIVDEELFKSHLSEVLDGTVIKLNNADEVILQSEFNKVLDEIRFIEEDFPTGNAPLNVLVVNLQEHYGIIEEKVIQILKVLLKRGLIYKPEKDCYKIT